MIGGLPYATWTRLTVHLSAEERAYAAELLSIALESDRHLPNNPMALARAARAPLPRFQRAWKKLTEPAEGFEALFVLTAAAGGGWYCPAQLAQVVENLLKSCEKPVDAGVGARGHRGAGLSGQYGLSGQGGTGTGPVGQNGLVRTGTPAPTVHEAPIASLPEPLAAIGRTPFPTFGLTDACYTALAVIVAFWRRRFQETDLISLQAGLEHAKFNELVYDIAAEYGVATDAVVGELWSPPFWRTRPELAVTKTTIAPSPAIFEVVR